MNMVFMELVMQQSNNFETNHSFKNSDINIAIMQPTYLPWIGYFSLINKVDKFVFLDNVQFSKRSWQQRNQIKTASGSQWLTVPVLSKGKRDQKIMDVVIDYTKDFPRNHILSLEKNYNNSLYFKKYMPDLHEILIAKHYFLSDLTIKIIIWLMEVLQISTKIYKSSDFNVIGIKDELLAGLCAQLRGSKYISPPGSSEYLETSKAFENKDIIVQYFNFSHPKYLQKFGDFLPYMSILDLLFNCGPESKDIIMNNEKII